MKGKPMTLDILIAVIQSTFKNTIKPVYLNFLLVAEKTLATLLAKWMSTKFWLF